MPSPSPTCTEKEQLPFVHSLKACKEPPHPLGALLRCEASHESPTSLRKRGEYKNKTKPGREKVASGTAHCSYRTLQK